MNVYLVTHTVRKPGQDRLLVVEIRAFSTRQKARSHIYNCASQAVLNAPAYPLINAGASYFEILSVEEELCRWVILSLPIEGDQP